MDGNHDENMQLTSRINSARIRTSDSLEVKLQQFHIQSGFRKWILRQMNGCFPSWHSRLKSCHTWFHYSMKKYWYSPFSEISELTLFTFSQHTIATQPKWQWKHWSQAPWRLRPSWMKPMSWRHCSMTGWCASTLLLPRQSQSISSLNLWQMVTESSLDANIYIYFLEI